MPSRTLHKPVQDGTYIVEWAKFIGPREHPELKEWVMDVGRIEGDWFRSFDGKTRKKVSSEYFLVKRRIRRTALNMPGECVCGNKRRYGGWLWRFLCRPAMSRWTLRICGILRGPPRLQDVPICPGR